jgi:RNA polymerase sigma-70 factor (ECF subfamily)
VAEPVNASITLELVDRARRNDEQAADMLFRRLRPLVLKLVRSYPSRRTSESDLCQIVFSRVFGRLCQWRGEGKFKTWVARIAINTCIKEICSDLARPELRFADLDAAQVESVQKYQDSLITEPIQEQDKSSVILESFSTLTPRDRSIIVMLYFEGRSVEEIRRATGLSAASIKVRAFRARKVLKRRLIKMLQ